MSDAGTETFWLTPEERTALQNYRAARRALESLGLIRSDRSTVGEVAERIVCRAMKLSRADSRVRAAYDARDEQGATYQIKARMVADLKGHTSFDFKVSPTGFDYLVAVLLTHDYEPLVMIRVPLAEVQRHCCASADGLRFRWTQDPLTAEWLTIYRPVTPE